MKKAILLIVVPAFFLVSCESEVENVPPEEIPKSSEADKAKPFDHSVVNKTKAFEQSDSYKAKAFDQSDADMAKTFDQLARNMENLARQAQQNAEKWQRGEDVPPHLQALVNLMNQGTKSDTSTPPTASRKKPKVEPETSPQIAEAVAQREIDACLVGTWLSDPTTVEAQHNWYTNYFVAQSEYQSDLIKQSWIKKGTTVVSYTKDGWTFGSKQELQRIYVDSDKSLGDQFYKYLEKYPEADSDMHLVLDTIWKKSNDFSGEYSADSHKLRLWDYVELNKKGKGFTLSSVNGEMECKVREWDDSKVPPKVNRREELRKSFGDSAAKALGMLAGQMPGSAPSEARSKSQSAPSESDTDVSAPSSRFERGKKPDKRKIAIDRMMGEQIFKQWEESIETLPMRPEDRKTQREMLEIKRAQLYQDVKTSGYRCNGDILEVDSEYATLGAPPIRYQRVKSSYEPEQVLVATKDPGDAEQLERWAKCLGYGSEEAENLAGLDMSLSSLRVPKGENVEQAVQQLGKVFPDAKFVPNYRYSLEPDERVSADTRASQNYAYELIGWTEETRGCALNRRIGLIDTALDTAHPALRSARIHVKNIVPAGAKQAGPDHGTAVASLLVGNEQERGFSGLLPQAELFSVNVFRKGEQVISETTTKWLIQAMDHLVKQGVDAINMSLGASQPDDLLDQAIQKVVSKNIFMVAAAGNSGEDTPPAYPAEHPSVIAVTAVDANQRIYRSANRGDAIEFSAPGVYVWTAKAGGGGSFVSGTSYAVPFVTSVVVTMRALHGNEDPQALRQRLARTAQDLGSRGRDPVYGWGLVKLSTDCPQTATR